MLDISVLFLKNPEVGFLIDPAGVIQAATAGAERTLGYGPGEFTGLDLPRLEEGEGVRSLLARPVTSRWNLDLVLRLRTKAGRVFTARAVAAPLIGESGERRGWMVWAQDLVEAFEQSRETKTVLDGLVDSIGAALWSFDANGVVLTWSRTCESFFGYARAEVEGKLQAAGLFPSPDEYRRGVREVDEKGRFSGEVALTGCGGQVRLCQLLVTRLASPAGGPSLGYSVVSFDLSERKRAEEFHRALFSQAGEAMVVVEAETGRITDCNAKFCEIHGYARDEVLHLRISDLTAEGDMSRILLRIDPVLRESGRFLEGSVLHRRKDGSHFPCEINLRLLKGEHSGFVIAIIRDLTEKHRAAEFFRVLFEKSVDGAYIVDDEGLRVAEVNEAICRLLGYTRPEILSLTVRDLTPPAFHDRIEGVRQLVKVERLFERTRLGLLRKDGQVVLTDHLISRMEFGGKIYYLASARDVTDQVRTERALEEARVLLEKFRDEAPDPMYILDGEGRLQYVNASGCRLLGLSEEKVQGRSFADFTPPDRLALNREMFARALQGETVRFRTEVLGADGARIPIEINGAGLEVGGRAGTMGVARPIADQVWAERELQRANEELTRANAKLHEEVAERRRVEGSLQLYREILAHASEGVIILDSQHVIREQNEAHRRLLGYSDEEVIGKTPMMFAPDFQSVRAELREKGGVRKDVPNRTKAGKDLMVDVSIFPMRGDSGEIRYYVVIKRDVTERRRSEGKIAALAEEMGLLLANARDFLYRHDAKGVFTYVSPSIEQITGFTPQEWLRHYSEKMTDNPANRKVLEYTEETLRTGKQSPPYSVEVRCKDGRIILLEVNERAVWESGKVVGIVGVARDITERKRAEERAAAQHAVTRALAETDSFQEAVPRILHALGSSLGWLAGVYWSVDADAGVLRCTRVWHEPSRPVDAAALEKVTLRPGEWLPGRVWAGGVPLWVADMAREDGGTGVAKSGLHAAFAFPLRGTSGILGVVELLRTEVLDPDPELICLTDTLGGQISQFVERKQAEEALRFQKALLESQSEAAIDGILVISTAGKVVSYNRRLLAMWDLPQEVLRDRSETNVLNFILGKVADPEGFLRRVRFIEEHADQESRDEVPLKDGRAFERYIAPVRSLDGVSYGRVLFFRDVTGRKRAEEGLRRAVEDARHAYDDLKQAQVQLIRSEKLASIGMLVSGVAHEINNPLNVIYGNLRLLEGGWTRDRAGTPTRRVKRMVRDALKGADHARRIVEDFRNFARDTRIAEPVDLNRCLEETLKILSRQLPPEVKVERRVGRLLLVRGFKGQLNQVFLNLVKNAAEAIEGKGKITVRTMRHKGLAVVEVADTGRGIPPDVQKNIFEPFFTTKPVGKGLGLGLSISATIVHNHGGQISVRSRVGRGTVFRVEFPISP